MQTLLQKNTDLKLSKHVEVPEKLAMFVETVGRKTTNCGVQEMFQHSGDTISQYFHEVLNAFVQMNTYYVNLPDKRHQTDKQIMDDSKYASYLGNCLGALDETHIEVYVPYEKRISY